MFEILQTALESPLIIWLTLIYIISTAISTYDSRLIQWKRLGDIPQDFPTPPAWTFIFGILDWISFIVMLILNWRFALILFAIIFLLRILPVMENIGKILTAPFVSKKN